jgi:hypothetical protein
MCYLNISVYITEETGQGLVFIIPPVFSGKVA